MRFAVFLIASIATAACSSITNFSAWQPEPTIRLDLHWVSSPGPLPDDVVLQQLYRAAGEIEAVLPVQVEIHTADPPAGSCEVRWGTFLEIYTATLDGLGTRAVAWPGRECRIVFARLDLFEDAKFFRTVLMHEIGHLLGMPHNFDDAHSYMTEHLYPERRYQYTPTDAESIH